MKYLTIVAFFLLMILSLLNIDYANIFDWRTNRVHILNLVVGMIFLVYFIVKYKKIS